MNSHRPLGLAGSVTSSAAEIRPRSSSAGFSGRRDYQTIGRELARIGVDCYVHIAVGDNVDERSIELRIGQPRPASHIIGQIQVLRGDVEGQHRARNDVVEAVVHTRRRQKIGDHRPPVEQASVERDLAFLRSLLDDSTFEELWRKGGSLTQEQALVLASSSNS